MYKVKRKDPISIESSSKNDINCINTKRNPIHRICFYNPENGHRFYTDDVKLMAFKRNNRIDEFFEIFSSKTKYTMIEFGFDFNITNRISDILLVIRRNFKRINLPLRGFIWIVDKGKINGTMHFHLTVVTDALDYSGKQLPNQLKMKYKNKKIYSRFVDNRISWKDYLKKKDIMFIGKSKRVFGKSNKLLKKV
jgi:hypothetical protein